VSEHGGAGAGPPSPLPPDWRTLTVVRAGLVHLLLTNLALDAVRLEPVRVRDARSATVAAQRDHATATHELRAARDNSRLSAPARRPPPSVPPPPPPPPPPPRPRTTTHNAVSACGAHARGAFSPRTCRVARAVLPFVRHHHLAQLGLALFTHHRSASSSARPAAPGP
jgi:hypothetical protein